MLDQNDLKWIAATSTNLNSMLQQIARYTDLARRHPDVHNYVNLRNTHRHHPYAEQRSGAYRNSTIPEWFDADQRYRNLHRTERSAKRDGNRHSYGDADYHAFSSTGRPDAKRTSSLRAAAHPGLRQRYSGVLDAEAFSKQASRICVRVVALADRIGGRNSRLQWWIKRTENDSHKRAILR